jgi:hypothetical protein
MDRRIFHSELKEIARQYSGAMDRYERAMLRGEPAGADEAIGDMPAIEKSIVIIKRPQK